MNAGNIALAVFIGCFASIIYVHVLYPAIVYLIGHLRPIPVIRTEIEPTVSIIITAHNEERDIRRKLENTLLIDYPKHKLEIIVASDCSTDETDRIVSSFAHKGIILCRQNTRHGKTSAQNKAVEQATGDVVLFSDATTIYQSNVLRSLIPGFADEKVGCIAGKLIYQDPGDTNVGSGATGYWNFESFLKRRESLACSLIGASGCLYAVRRSAYEPMYPEACSDFLIATQLYRNGYRTIYEPEAICIEETNRESAREFEMRVRVIAQTFTDLWRNRDMLNPFKSGFFAVELISHKLMRYALPIFMLGTLVSSAILALSSFFFALVFALQFVIYTIAVVGGIFDRFGIRLGIGSLPFYFVLANTASVVGFYKFLTGERYAYWEPLRSEP